MMHHLSVNLRLLTVLMLTAGAFASNVPRIMPLGDTRTAGPEGRYSYRLYLDRMLTHAGYGFDFVGTRKGHGADDTPSDSLFDADHQGMWEWPTDSLLPHLGAWVRATDPDIVLALLGALDVLREVDDLDTKIARTVREIEAAIDTIRSVNPSAVILLANSYPVNSTTWASVLELFNQRIPGVAVQMSTPASPVVFVDVATGFRRFGDLVDTWNANDSGSIKVAQRWFDALRPILDSRAPASSAQWRMVPVDDPSPEFLPLRTAVRLPAGGLFSVTGRMLRP